MKFHDFFVCLTVRFLSLRSPLIPTNHGYSISIQGVDPSRISDSWSIATPMCCWTDIDLSIFAWFVPVTCNDIQVSMDDNVIISIVLVIKSTIAGQMAMNLLYIHLPPDSSNYCWWTRHIIHICNTCTHIFRYIYICIYLYIQIFQLNPIHWFAGQGQGLRFHSTNRSKKEYALNPSQQWNSLG